MCFVNPSLNTHVNKNQRNWGGGDVSKLMFHITNSSDKLFINFNFFFLQMLTLYKAQEPLKVEGN